MIRGNRLGVDQILHEARFDQLESIDLLSDVLNAQHIPLAEYKYVLFH